MLLRNYDNFGAHSGNLVAVNGSIIQRYRGNPVQVRVNDTAVDNARLNNTRVTDGSTITVSNGSDVTEPHTTKTVTIAHGTDVHDLGGVIQYVSRRGSDGLKEEWTGHLSGQTVTHHIIKQPINTQVTALTPRPAGKKVIALTFDDGPSQYSDAILDILKQQHVKATFFDLGAQSVQYAKVEQRMVKEGHQVASHTTTHQYLPGLSTTELRNEITRSFTALNRTSGVKTRVMRAPYGAFTAQDWQRSGDLIDMNVLWDIDTLDWKMPGADAIRKTLVSNAHNGAIALMHDGGGDRSQDIAALPGIISDLKKQGYQFVTVDQLIAMSQH